MKIELHEIPISDVVSGYIDSKEEGVIGYSGKLDIRPKYQREFIYKEEQRNEVINTIIHNFPLNIMYWVKTPNGYELMDGQQRTLSICQYINGDFSFNSRYFHNLTKDEQQQILNYKLMIYICEGTDKEKLDWFKVINIAGEKLTNQELRNAVYSGTWVTAAKRYFSKTQCPAIQLADNYISGTPIRQEILEKVLTWLVDQNNLPSIEEYMAQHQHDKNANAEWLYFQSVISWAKATFPKKRKELKSVNWGYLYNHYGQNIYDPDYLEQEILRLIDDDDVQKISGIYYYLLTGEEKYLNIRTFDDKTKKKVYKKQNGKCNVCKKEFSLEEMEGDHIIPWCEGGHTTEDNCQMLCKTCNRKKGSK